MSRVLCIVLLVFGVVFGGCFAAEPGQQFRGYGKVQRAVSTAVFRVGGAVYPDGYFFVKVFIGNPPKPYYLDVDTGSDLTWVQCDAPCVNCPKGPHDPYKPRNNVVRCHEPLCAFIPHPVNYPCRDPADQCDYEIQYADSGLSTGVLVKDYFPIQLLNGSVLNSFISFGCGYDQNIPGSSHPPFVDGVLGLASGKSSILSQLSSRGVIRDVFGHCFSTKGGGYLFFGDDMVPSTGMVWAPMLQNKAEKHYSIGPIELLFDGKNIVKGGQPLIFDSGSTYTYFNGLAYKSLVSMIMKSMNKEQLKDAPEDRTLPLCWKGAQFFKSASDVKSLFQPLALRINKNIVMEIPPEAYLIISKKGNVCLGILDGSEVQLSNLNVLGDISLQDKLVIYDNVKKRIGWMSASCETLPNTDHDYLKATSLSLSISEDLYDEL